MAVKMAIKTDMNFFKVKWQMLLSFVVIVFIGLWGIAQQTAADYTCSYTSSNGCPTLSGNYDSDVNLVGTCNPPSGVFNINCSECGSGSTDACTVQSSGAFDCGSASEEKQNPDGTYTSLGFWTCPGSIPSPACQCITSSGGGGGGYCGDGICNNGEDSSSCPADCSTGGGGGGSSYTISLTTYGSGIVSPGGSTSYGITINPTNYTKNIALTTTNCPPNATCTISPATVTNSGGYTATLQITAGANTPVGTYSTISVHGVGTDNYTADSNQVTLYVNPVSSQYAVCDNTWHNAYGAPSGIKYQPVTKYYWYNNGYNQDYFVGVAYVNNGYVPSYSYCAPYFVWNGFGYNSPTALNPCYWPTTGTYASGSIPGTSYTSPYTFTGQGWDIMVLGTDNNTYHIVRWPFSGWSSGWTNMGISPQPWGTPYFIPASGFFNNTASFGDNWQVRNNGGTLQYQCGPSTTCEPLVYSASTSGFAATPNSATPSSSYSATAGSTFYAYCDYNSVLSNPASSISLTSSPSAGVSCSRVGTYRTAQVYSCSIAAAGSYTFSCSAIAGTSDNVCSSGPISIGTVTASPPPPPTASLTANASHNITVGVGASINYAWSSQYADTYTANYIGSPVSCGSGVWATANGSSGGTNTGVTTSGQNGCTYTITYTAKNSSTNQSASDSITVAVASPTIQLSPSSMSFGPVVSGGSAPANQTFTISNTGSAALNWTWSRVDASGNPSGSTWCVLKDNSGNPIAPGSGGTIGAGTSGFFKVGVTAPSNVGTFNDCNIRISDPNATNNPQTLSLTYTIKPGDVDSGSQPNTFSVGLATCPTVGIALAWSPGSGANSYNIYRNTSNTIPGSVYKTVSAQNGNVGTQTYSDAVTSGGPYYYWVQSVDTNSGLAGTIVPADANTTGPGVSPQSCPPNRVPDGSFNGDNSTCQQITLSWAAPSVDASHPAPTNYWIYRNTTGVAPTPGYSSPGPSYLASVSYPSTSYVDGPNLTSNTYYYWIISVNNGSPASAVTQLTGSSVFAYDCGANLDKSDKDVTGDNGVTFTGMGTGQNVCNGYQAIPASTIFYKGDNVQFRIQVCNNAAASQGTATNIVVVDQLTNLGTPTNLQYVDTGGVSHNFSQTSNCVTPSTIGQYSLCGTAPNQTITFRMPDIPKGQSLPITYSAVIIPSGTLQSAQGIIQNSAIISYTAKAGLNLSTPNAAIPPIPFSTGQSYPSRSEN